MKTLLKREEFERRVFERDDHKCVICDAPAQDAHHLIERRLWTEPDEAQGYFVENGVSVCGEHHKAAEQDFIPPQAFRQLLDLPTVLPRALDPDGDYSKWGVPFKLPTRENAKYPSTSYLDISPNQHGGNDVIETSSFFGFPAVVTLKMDGSNVVLRHDSMGARNGDTAHHRSFDMLKAIHAGIRKRIHPSLEIFCEWLYARHSIHYTGGIALPSYLMVIGVYDVEYRVWLSWTDTVRWANLIGYPTVPVLRVTAPVEQHRIYAHLQDDIDFAMRHGHEGIVVRNAYAFHYGQFGRFVGKYVRENHVQTDDHWQSGPIVKNELADPDPDPA